VGNSEPTAAIKPDLPSSRIHNSCHSVRIRRCRLKPILRNPASHKEQMLQSAGFSREAACTVRVKAIGDSNRDRLYPVLDTSGEFQSGTTATNMCF
jgi:hypothetical protein